MDKLLCGIPANNSFSNNLLLALAIVFRNCFNSLAFIVTVLGFVCSKTVYSLFDRSTVVVDIPILLLKVDLSISRLEIFRESPILCEW